MDEHYVGVEEFSKAGKSARSNSYDFVAKFGFQIWVEVPIDRRSTDLEGRTVTPLEAILEKKTMVNLVCIPHHLIVPS